MAAGCGLQWHLVAHLAQDLPAHTSMPGSAWQGLFVLGVG
jgi:hypothetical protein